MEINVNNIINSYNERFNDFHENCSMYKESDEEIEKLNSFISDKFYPTKKKIQNETGYRINTVSIEKNLRYKKKYGYISVEKDHDDWYNVKYYGKNEEDVITSIILSSEFKKAIEKEAKKQNRRLYKALFKLTYPMTSYNQHIIYVNIILKNLNKIYKNNIPKEIIEYLQNYLNKNANKDNQEWLYDNKSKKIKLVNSYEEKKVYKTTLYFTYPGDKKDYKIGTIYGTVSKFDSLFAGTQVFKELLSKESFYAFPYNPQNETISSNLDIQKYANKNYGHEWFKKDDIKLAERYEVEEYIKNYEKKSFYRYYKDIKPKIKLKVLNELSKNISVHNAKSKKKVRFYPNKKQNHLN